MAVLALCSQQYQSNWLVSDMSDSWSDGELRAAVQAYVEMRQLEIEGISFSKKSYYRDLATRFGRTEKSFEFRMQNISFVYSLQGRRWVTGLKPARNVGANVIKRLEDIITSVEGQWLGSDAAFDAEVSSLQRKTVAPPPGNKTPAQIESVVTQYTRDAAVVAWVLQNAGGICESCDSPAPFIREDGSPYLEVHHVTRLADGGEDTIRNAIALCPNCHRELHYGTEKQRLAAKLRSKVTRLA